MKACYNRIHLTLLAKAGQLAFQWIYVVNLLTQNFETNVSEILDNFDVSALCKQLTCILDTFTCIS